MAKVTVEFDEYLEIAEVISSLEKRIDTIKELIPLYPDTSEAFYNCLNAAELALAKMKVAKNQYLNSLSKRED